MAMSGATPDGGGRFAPARLGWAATIASVVLGSLLLAPYGALLLLIGVVGGILMFRKTRGAGLGGGVLLAVLAVPAVLVPVVLWADGHRPNWTVAIACLALALAATALWITLRGRTGRSATPAARRWR